MDEETGVRDDLGLIIRMLMGIDEKLEILLTVLGGEDDEEEEDL